jgi:hypothetical protein
MAAVTLSALPSFMPEPARDPDADPRPPPPVEPEPGDCCGSGCPLCVYDLYAEEVARYRERLAQWRQRHPGQE